MDNHRDDHGHAPGLPVWLPDEELGVAADIFKAVGDRERLRLLVHLTGGERCVSELAETVDASLSTISQRLRVLRAEGLVRRRRDGKHVYYDLADDHVAVLLASALDHAHEPAASRDSKDAV